MNGIVTAPRPAPAADVQFVRAAYSRLQIGLHDGDASRP